MLIDPGVLDANVLVYAVDADAPQHTASRTFAGCGQRRFGNALRDLADTLRILFDHHQPATGQSGLFLRASIKHHFSDAGPAWSECAAEFRLKSEASLIALPSALETGECRAESHLMGVRRPVALRKAGPIRHSQF